jgi:hypothetical protein
MSKKTAAIPSEQRRVPFERIDQSTIKGLTSA